MKFLILISLLFTFFSCAEKEQKVIDIKDIQAQSKKSKDKQAKSTDGLDSTTIALNQFKNAGLQLDGLTFLDKNLFPDRFRPKSTLKFEFKNEDQYSQYYRWNFEDSALVVNALFNWLDYFDVDQFGAEQNFQKEAFCMLIADTSLVFVNNNHLRYNQWVSIHEHLGLKEFVNFAVVQGKGGKARWYEFKEDEFVRIKDENSQ